MSVATWLQVSGTSTASFEKTTEPSVFRISLLRAVKSILS
jgi:hypothetical protein